ncbi:MAG: hypothetical protein ACK4ND_00060 [Cytophagaceae bacterium]
MPSIKPVLLTLNILIIFSITFTSLNLADMYIPGKFSEETFTKVYTFRLTILKTPRIPISISII